MVENSPFEELPEALVEDFLKQTKDVSDILQKQFKEINSSNKHIRELLKKKGLLKMEADYLTFAQPTCCGTDGSYITENLVSCDIVAMAGVAVEGLTPPSEKRHWPSPKHLQDILPESHNSENSSVARAIMICMELELATKAPHDIIFFDGSLATPAIFLNRGFGAMRKLNGKLKELMEVKGAQALKDYEKMLECKRTDQVYIGVPKASQRREVSDNIGYKSNYDDKGMLTFVLEPGEFVGPLKFSDDQNTKEGWHINLPPELKTEENKKIVKNIISLVEDLHVIYFRPYSWMPTIRFEIGSGVANDNNRIGLLLKGVKFQCTAPGVLEPYPTYLADRMVKHLSTAIPAIRKSAMQEMMLEDDEDSPNLFLSMHNYRTKSNR